MIPPTAEVPSAKPVEGRWRRLQEQLLGGSLSRTALRTSIATVVLSAATVVFNLGTTLLLTRELGASNYGDFAFAIAATGILSVLSVLGVAPLVIRSVAAYRVHEDWGRVRGIVRRAHQVLLVWSLALITLAAFAGLTFPNRRASAIHAYWIALPLVPLTALATVRQTVLQGFDRVVLARVPETLLQPLVFLGPAFSLAAVGALTATLATALYVLATASAFAIGLALLRRVLPPEVRRSAPVYDMPAWVKAAIPLFLLTLLNAFNDQVDVVLLGMFRGSAEAGIFSAADRASLLVGFLLLAATYPLAPVLARLWTLEARADLQRVINQSTRVIFGGSLLIAVGLVFYRHEVMRVFGPSFVSGQAALAILCLGQLVNTGTGTVGLVLMMTGHESDVSRAVAVGALVNVVLNATLIPLFGLVGAASATASAVAVANLLLLEGLWRKARLWAGIVGPFRRADRG